jgi:hypothetical protein
MKQSSKKRLTHHKNVILLSVPKRWRFFDFGYTKDNSEIQKWYLTLSERAQFLFDDLLRNNRDVELPIHWTGFRHFMQGNLKKEKIRELGFKSENVPHRVLGIFGTKRKTAVLLIGYTHKSNVYDPPGALETSVRRKRLLEETKADAIERQIRSAI